TKLLVAPAAMIMEDLGVLAALERSWRLTTNNWWRIFGTYLLTQIIASVIGGIVSVPVSLIVGLVAGMINPHPDSAGMISQQIITQGISSVVGSLVGAVTLAFTSGVLALIYVDLRMRKEGFDVVLMKENEDPNQANRDGIPGRPVAAATPPTTNGGWISGTS
ncbi:MAG: hypothetical protein HIU81_12330, partial [Acidobacteria bacterium]|nr:hypothetical protein [Acidobacteriota bacterium]